MISIDLVRKRYDSGLVTFETAELEKFGCGFCVASIVPLKNGLWSLTAPTLKLVKRFYSPANAESWLHELFGRAGLKVVRP